MNEKLNLKIHLQIPSGFSVSTIPSFRRIENTHDVYRGKDCLKKFCEFSSQQNENNFKKTKMRLLAKEQQESYENANICYFCEEKFENKYLKDQKYCKVRDHYHYTGEYRGAAQSIFNLRYSMLKNVLIDFHNGSNYDYHFMIKVLAKEFNEQFTCLGENTEKYITFTVPIEKKVTRIDKNGEQITRSVLYIAIY